MIIPLQFGITRTNIEDEIRESGHTCASAKARARAAGAGSIWDTGYCVVSGDYGEVSTKGDPEDTEPGQKGRTADATTRTKELEKRGKK